MDFLFIIACPHAPRCDRSEATRKTFKPGATRSLDDEPGYLSAQDGCFSAMSVACGPARPGTKPTAFFFGLSGTLFGDGRRRPYRTRRKRHEVVSLDGILPHDR